MKTISESSFYSEQFVNPSIAESKIARLEEVELELFQRITQLRNHKIKLMGMLSLQLDKKNQAENQLFRVIESKRKKQEAIVNESQCRQAILKNFELKEEQNELKSKTGKDYVANQEQQRMIEQIIKLRAQNKMLMGQLGEGETPGILHQILELRKKIDLTHHLIAQKKQNIVESNANLKQLLQYVQQQQNNKKMLYQELVEFQKGMQDLRAENEMLARLRL